ncbi:hypothetical protein QQF64_033098 [Cirrhinus molitorella]|uniref:Uncharacterized protein n=1 Tax=Cirrhinus molitorella TaxID=172907 RepID=A0ABR3MSW8_9TELE
MEDYANLVTCQDRLVKAGEWRRLELNWLAAAGCAASSPRLDSVTFGTGRMQSARPQTSQSVTKGIPALVEKADKAFCDYEQTRLFSCMNVFASAGGHRQRRLDAFCHLRSHSLPKRATIRRSRACKALSIIIAVSNQGDASGTVDALTAVIMYLHGDHFWPVMEARLAPPPLAFNQIGLSLVRWTAAALVPKTGEECLITCSGALLSRSFTLSLSLHPLAWSVLFHPVPPPKAGSVVSRLLCSSRLSLCPPPTLISEKEEPSRG